MSMASASKRTGSAECFRTRRLRTIRRKRYQPLCVGLHGEHSRRIPNEHVNQFESARPITITNADNTGRIYVNGVYTSLDEFRGTPYIQSDLRVARPFNFNERWQLIPVHRVLQSLQP
jgi:hypothetical protein